MSDAGGGAPPPAGGKKQLDLAETVKKLKRLVTLYKKEVDRLKEKESALLVELEEQKEQNRRAQTPPPALPFYANARPIEVAMRVKCKPSGVHWCYVKYDAEDDGGDRDSDGGDRDSNGSDEGVKYAWRREVDVVAQAEDFGVTLQLPDVLEDGETGRSTHKDLERQLTIAHDNIERVQEDFRRYRVRAEIVRRQKESEISKLMETSAEFNEQQLAFDSKVEDQLNYTKQVLAEKEGENKKLKAKCDSQKADWDRLKRENQQLKQLLDSGGARGDETLAAKHQKLKQEYQAYRKRAMQLLKNKGKDGGGGGAAAKKDQGIDAEAVVYLRNTVLKYMATDREEVREQMEGAIATVLRFNKQDLEYVSKQRSQSRSWAAWMGVS
jgi:hypothetical protein